MRLPVCLVCHDDFLYLRTVLRSFAEAGPATVFVSRRAWDGSQGDWEGCAKEAEGCGAEVALGDWLDEVTHRRDAIAEMRRRGHAHVLIPDTDEVVEPSLLEALLRIAEADAAERVRVHMDTYWSGPTQAIRPRERLTPILMLDCRVAELEYIREFQGGRQIVLPPEYGVLHHLSYAGPDERIERKIRAWSHKDELQPDWYRRVWLGWQGDKLMRNVHPTVPECYGLVERIPLPAVLEGAFDPDPVPPDPEVPKSWPKLSVVIPLYGGEEDVRLCLESLASLQDLIHETIVVDDLSPDAAPEVASEFPFARVLFNEENLGFAATCNRGYRESSGDVVLFLNSDTVVPRAGLVRLVESVSSGGTVGAAGPYTNECGHHQRIEPTYTSLDTLDLFARDFAARGEADREVDMLVGFCLAVRRSAMEEVGAFDERFGRGTFEDNDLCYRLRRAGYRLLVASRSYVHHSGSKSLLRGTGEHPAVLLRRNQALYEAKWREDVESGFSSHLAGLRSEPIVFKPERHPDAVASRIAELARRADVSLTMIVRNEERVLGECLSSAAGFFRQTVVVDTGSTDRTKQIILEHGVELHEMEWPDSFAGARNESLRHARGKWVFWMDADDTLPRWSAERILQAAMGAPPDVVGFVVPVQFIEQGGVYGTRVDHVKLFRNLPGLTWEGRIHEQILPSLGSRGRIERIDAVVLHSGYDTSEEGQRRKRERDWKLLRLDLDEDPEHPFKNFNYGMTAFYCGEHQDALRYLKRSVELAKPGESHVRKSYALMGLSRKELGDLAGALGAFEEGIERVGEDPELRFHGAMVLYELGRLDECREWYLKVREDAQHYASFDRGILGHKLHFNLGAVCQQLGRDREAKEAFRASLSEAPWFAPAARALFDLAMEIEDRRTAKEALGALGRATDMGEEWASCATRFELEGGGDPVRWLWWARGAFPAAVGPRLLLARSLLQQGREHAARELLEELESLRCAEGAYCLGVAHMREGRYEIALEHMLLAMELNPGHEETRRQVEALRGAISLARQAQSAPKPTKRQRRLLVGSHAGKLGEPARRYSVVVVTYNSAGTIDECLRRALGSMGEEDELIVVDNASGDGTVGLVEATIDPRLRLIRQESNLGYAKAANLGVLASSGARVALLNPDAFVSDGWLEALGSRLVEGVGAAGPACDNCVGYQHVDLHLPAGSRVGRERLAAVMARINRGKSFETRFLVGLCVMLPREVLRVHGLLDEQMELGADDLELSWRLTSLGYRLAIAPDVAVIHVGGASFASLPAEVARERVRRSDARLVRKLRAYYGRNKVPCAEEIWGLAAFEETLERDYGEGA